MRTIRIVRDSKYSAPEGLAIDEALLLSLDEDLASDTIRFYYFSPPSVVIGLNQDIYDINLEYLKKNKMSLGRRLTGGGAIIIGCPEYYSQMGISFLFKINQEIPSKLSDKFKFFGTILMKTLEKLDLKPEYNKNSDITLNGKKIIGNGIYQTENSLLFHSVILFDYDCDTMLKVLNLEVNTNREELLKIMKGKITTLNSEKNQKVSTTLIEDTIIDVTKNILKVTATEGDLSNWEKKMAAKLFKEKYNSTKWNCQSFDNVGLMGACFVPKKC